MFLSIGMLKLNYFLADIFILSAEKQPIKLSWRKIECLLASYKIEIMKELELRKPYRLQEIIEIVSKNIANNGFTDSNYCLYSNEGTAQLNQLCYLELYPTIDDNDEEVYPDFVRDKSLDLFYYGQQFEDVLMSVFDQKETASINDYIDALNYYMENDTFMDF